MVFKQFLHAQLSFCVFAQKSGNSRNIAFFLCSQTVVSNFPGLRLIFENYFLGLLKHNTNRGFKGPIFIVFGCALFGPSCQKKVFCTKKEETRKVLTHN